MQPRSMTRLLLIRHATSANAGRLAGRRDVPATLPGEEALAQARRNLAQWGAPSRVLTSPALRCRQTVSALFPAQQATEDARLLEQDFGAWEGIGMAELPDLGPLTRDETARFCPPGGESFCTVAARVALALRDVAANGDASIVTHAGVIRAALGLALGEAALGLAFELTPFSATLLTMLPGEIWSIGGVNLNLAAP